MDLSRGERWQGYLGTHLRAAATN